MWRLVLFAIGIAAVLGRQVNVGFFYSGDESPLWPQERTRYTAELAVAHVTQSGQLPADTSINLLPLSTGCVGENAITEALPFVQISNLDLAVGPACSTETSALISFLAHPFFRNHSLQIPFILPEAPFTTPITELETKLHRRLIPSETFQQSHEKRMVNHFGWHRIGIVYDIDYIRQIQHIKTNWGSELVALVFISPDYTKTEIQRALQSFKDADVKIIRFATLGAVIEPVICAAEEMGMLGPDYVWSAAAALWHTFQQKFPQYCTEEQIQRLRKTDGPLDIAAHPINVEVNGTILTDVGRTSAQFEQELLEYHTTLNYTGGVTIYDYYVYDSIWVVAKNIEAITAPLVGEERLMNIFQSFDENEFYGVSSRVGFLGTGPKYPSGKLRRLKGWDWNRSPEHIATVDDWGVEVINEMDWALGEVPLDYTPRVVVNFSEQLVRIDTTFILCYDSLAAVIIVMLLAILFVNVYFRNQKLIRLTSPIMNCVIVVGAMILMLAIVVHSMEAFVNTSAEATWICRARFALVLLGFTLGFGALFAKAWRVYRALTGGQGVTISNNLLLGQVFAFLAVDICLYAAWQVVWPIEAVVYNSTLEETQVGELELRRVQLIFFQCESEQPYFLYALLVEKTLLLLFGGFIAFETRNVHIEALNDSKSIGISIYNVGFCCAFAFISSVIVSADPSVSFLLYGGILMFCTVFPTAVLFGPRILGLVRDPSGKGVSVRAV